MLEKIGKGQGQLKNENVDFVVCFLFCFIFLCWRIPVSVFLGKWCIGVSPYHIPVSVSV
jgi:hypothetical protein